MSTLTNRRENIMNIAHLPQLPFSSTKGWQELENAHPSVVKVFILLALPLSLLPPLMLYYAGTYYGDALFPGGSAKSWNLIAVIFFLAEMITFAAMGWLIKEVASTYKLEISLHDAYLLAAICPIPLWLSSLGLLVPSLQFNAALSLLALGLSCAIIYHGIYALCHMQEETLAVGFTYTVMGAGIVAWVFLLLLVILPV